MFLNPAHLGDLSLEGVDPRGVLGALFGEDRGLDLVDVDLERRADRFVAVDDDVAHGIDDCRRAEGEDLPILFELGPCGAELGACSVTDDDDEIGSQEDVDLAGLDRVLVVDVPQGLQGEEQRVVVQFQFGSLLCLECVLHRQWVQSEGRGDMLEFLRRRIVQPDPDEVAFDQRGPGGNQVVGRAVQMHARPVAVARQVDHHGPEASARSG